MPGTPGKDPGPNVHAAMMGFGLDRVGKYGQIDELLAECPAVRPLVAQRLTRAAYQTEYGIYDHANPAKHPLADVLMHPKEDTWEGGPYLTHVRRFYSQQYQSKFGLTLKEYWEMPYWLAEFHYELALSMSENLSPEERRAKSDFEQLQASMKG